MPPAYDNPGGLPPWQARGSALQVHLVFVTKYRRGKLDAAMLKACEAAMRKARDNFGADLHEFGGEGDHAHLLVEYPPKVPYRRW
jgi:REP-associated tyrosine transposase